jgi:ketosteroid isomerase-like protein
MPTYTETEQRNLDVVRQMFGEADGPTDKSELFADDGAWWNGLPFLPGAVGRTEHRGKEQIRNLLPSQRQGEGREGNGKGLGPGQDIYDMKTGRAEDVVMLADGDWVVRQQTFAATTVRGKDYRNVYCFVFRFNDDGKIQYLTEHWNTWHAYRMLFNNIDPEPAHPLT